MSIYTDRFKRIKSFSMKQIVEMFSLYFLLLVGTVAGSHYRGGTMSYAIRSLDNITTAQQISVRITQRHSWRRSAFMCNNTNTNTGDIIGAGLLQTNQIINGLLPSINTAVRCTDYNEEFDYSSGENSTTFLLPLNRKMEFFYEGCCWIPLLPPDSESNWSLKFMINTNRRADGTLNNSPKTTMNPIVQVEVGKTHVIRIPMADSDGDPIRCRWGNSTQECGSICAPKGRLISNPCELTYNASKMGYHAVAVVIEDFDSNNNVISAIPLQFLIHIVNTTTINEPNCTDLPFYIGDWPQDSCIGVESNSTIHARIQIRIPCQNTTITLDDILTISPAGLIKGKIIRDPSDQNLYTMPIEWTPDSDQYGIHQLCVTPVDSLQRAGSQVCLTFQVDISPPEFVRMTPTGLVSATQSLWTIQTDRDIVEPRRSNGVYIRFFKRSSNQEIYRIDVTNDSSHVFYQPRKIIFFTTGYIWEQGEEYYILLDSGIATINESCGIQSVQITDPYAWPFRVAIIETTSNEQSITTQSFVSTTTDQSSSTAQITSFPSPTPRSTTSNEESITTQSFVSTTTDQSSSIAQITSSPTPRSTTSIEDSTSTKPLISTTTDQSSSTAQITSSPTPRSTTSIEDSTSTKPLISTTTDQSSSTSQITSSSPSPRSTTSFENSNSTQPFVSTTTEQSNSTRQITSTSPRPTCPQWFQFNRISNETTSANEPYFTFCFTVETSLADVTIAANTWVSCSMWKYSGTADPLLELYTEPDGELLAENDDGNNITNHNCYAAVLSYRLKKGNYRVIIRNPKCSYGKFELRLSAEIDRILK